MPYPIQISQDKGYFFLRLNDSSGNPLNLTDTTILSQVKSPTGDLITTLIVEKVAAITGDLKFSLSTLMSPGYYVWDVALYNQDAELIGRLPVSQFHVLPVVSLTQP